MFISSSELFSKPRASNGTTRFREDSGRDHFSLSDIAGFCRRYWLTLTLPVVVTLLACMVYLKTAVPIFTARAQIIIDPRVQEQWNGQAGNAVLALDTAQVESQIAVLRSERIAKSVIAALNLADDDEFQPQPSILPRFPASIWAPSPIDTTASAKSRLIMESFAGNLDVRRSGMSYAIDISFSSRNPERAAQVANATAEAYIQDQLAARSETARVGGDWLEVRTSELRNQMGAAMRAVQEFKARRDYRITRLGDGRSPPTPGTVEGAGKTSPAPADTLEDLETKAQIYQRVYESFLQGFTEAVQRQSFPVADARVLTPATAPFSKTQPHGTMIMALGLLVSGLAGLGTALIRHQLDRTIRTPQQVRAELGIECLGCVPFMSPPGWRLRLRRDVSPAKRQNQQAQKKILQRVVRQTPSYFNAAFQPSATHMRDALVAIKERIEIHMRPAGRISFGITSSREGEGKSMLACNLASLFARSGRRTLVVDAHPRHPTLSAVTNTLSRPGLPEVIAGKVSLDQARVRLPDTLIDVLPAGCISADPAIVWQDDTGALQTMIGSTMEDYEVVIFDLPPMTPSHGGLALCLCLDGVVLTIEAGKTSQNPVAEDIHWLQNIQSKILGAVLNKSGD
ncbi:MAG TPA: AAA family ATPase [Ancylobacter sp.]